MGMNDFPVLDIETTGIWTEACEITELVAEEEVGWCVGILAYRKRIWYNPSGLGERKQDRK